MRTTPCPLILIVLPLFTGLAELASAQTNSNQATILLDQATSLAESPASVTDSPPARPVVLLQANGNRARILQQQTQIPAVPPSTPVPQSSPAPQSSPKPDAVTRPPMSDVRLASFQALATSGQQDPVQQPLPDEQVNPFVPNQAKPATDNQPAASAPPIPDQTNPNRVLQQPEAVANPHQSLPVPAQPWQTYPPTGMVTDPGWAADPSQLQSFPPSTTEWTDPQSDQIGYPPMDSMPERLPQLQDPAWMTGGAPDGLSGRMFHLDLLVGSSSFDDVDAIGLFNDGSTTRLEFDSGYNVGVRLGLFHGQNLRSDFELGLAGNDVAITYQANGLAAPTETSGELTTYTGMSNVYWDFVRFPTRRLKPYVGGGIGFLYADSDWTRFDPVAGQTFLDSDSGLMLQGMIGATFRWTEQVDLFAEYRVFDADALTLSTERGVAPGPNLANQSLVQPSHFDLKGDAISFGLRMKF